MNKILTYDIVKDYYIKGYYSNKNLKELCTADVITQSQYTSLTGRMYWEDID